MTKTTPRSVPGRGRLTSAGSASGRITELYTLGGVRVLCEGNDETSKLGPRHVALLVFLYHEARPLHPSELVDLLGRGQEEEKELDRLHKAINWLRNNVTGVDISFNGDTIETYGGVRLDTRELDAAIDGRDPEHVAALYTGEFLEGFESGAPAFDEWAQRERGRLQRAWGNAILARAREADRRREWHVAALWWKVLVATAPMRVDAVAGLLSAYAHAARWGEVAEVFENYSALLKSAGTSKIPHPVGRVIAEHPRLKDIAKSRLPAEETASEPHEQTPSSAAGATPTPIAEGSSPDDAAQDRAPKEPVASPEETDEPVAEMPLGALGDTELLLEPTDKPLQVGANSKVVTEAGDREDDEVVEDAEREPWKEFLELPNAGEPDLAPPIEVPRGPRPDDDDEHPFGRPGRPYSDLWGPSDPLEEARAAARSYVSIPGKGTTRVKHEITSVRKPWRPALESAWHELRPWLGLVGAALMRGLVASLRLVVKVPAMAGLVLMAALGRVRRTSSGIRSGVSSIAERRRDARRERTAERARRAAEARAAAAAETPPAVEPAVRKPRTPADPQPVARAPSPVLDEPRVQEQPERPSPAGEPDVPSEADASSEPATTDEPDLAGELTPGEELDVEDAPVGDTEAIRDTAGVDGPTVIEGAVTTEAVPASAVPGVEEAESVEQLEWIEEPEWVEEAPPTPGISSPAPATRRAAVSALTRTRESLLRVRRGRDWSRASGLMRRYWFAPLGVALLLAALLFLPGIIEHIGGLSQDLRVDLPEVRAPVPRVALPKVAVPRVTVRTPAFVETSVSKIGAMLSGAVLSSPGQWLLVADVQFEPPQPPPSVPDAARAAGVPVEDEGATSAIEETTRRGSDSAPPARSGRRRSPEEVLPEDRDWSPRVAALTTALEADIGQARAYNVVPRERALNALAGAGASSGQRLPLERALSLATVERYAAVIAAHVRQRSAGPDSVEIQVLSASGDTLYGVAAEVGEDMTTLEVLSGLSRAVRRRLGEPAAGVEASPPSTQLLSGSLPALEAYAEARMHLYGNRYSKAIAAARGAIARDSTFAMAYRTLAEAYALQGLRPRARTALETAWELSGRLDERERYRLLADRLAWDGQYSDAALTYDELFQRYRDEAAALRCLALVQRTIGVRGGGEGNLSVAYAIDPHDWPSLSHVARYLGYSGPLPDVDSLIASMDTVPRVTE